MTDLPDNRPLKRYLVWHGLGDPGPLSTNRIGEYRYAVSSFVARCEYARARLIPVQSVMARQVDIAQ